MTSSYRIETETDPSGAYAEWGAVTGTAGRMKAALLARTDNETIRTVLATGMLYVSGPGLPGNTLFRVEGCRRARMPEAMFISAVEAVDPDRCRENSILREMGALLDLECCEERETYLSHRAC